MTCRPCRARDVQRFAGLGAGRARFSRRPTPPRTGKINSHFRRDGVRWAATGNRRHSPGDVDSAAKASSAVPYPKLLRVRQKFERPRVEDAAATVRAELERIELGRTIRPGQSVALTAGSRGIANIPLVFRTVAEF